ncbi:MAG: SUMF1/EgtB/PvdO family nonheme iron enzyme [Patescibacteria group bacterium]|nr:SUMF1/EgtB/PvdO family nonheme iron enzyme [Patescibacteria group bacterium]
MLKIILKIFKSLVIGVLAVFLVALSIDASENYNNMSESILGKIIFGESEGLCEEGMVHVLSETGGFCIDKYEASPGEECPYVEIDNQKKTNENLNAITCKPVSEEGKLPWRYVSQSQAAAVCAKAGKRLASSKEWYQASLGTPDPNHGWAGNDCQVNNNWDDQPGLTGSGVNCQSGMGAMDMVGNVWEWVSGNLHEGEIDGQKLPEEGYILSVNSDGLPVKTSFEDYDDNNNRDYLWIKHTKVRGVARGGYWANKADAGIYAMYLVAPLDFAGTGIGFRCVK